MTEFTEEHYYELFGEYHNGGAYEDSLWSVMESVFEYLDECDEPDYDDAYEAAMEQLDNEVIYYSDCEEIITAYGLSEAFDAWNDFVSELGEWDISLTHLAYAVLYQNMPDFERVVELWKEEQEEEEEEE